MSDKQTLTYDIAIGEEEHRMSLEEGNIMQNEILGGLEVGDE